MPDNRRESYARDIQPDWIGGVVDGIALDRLGPNQSSVLRNAEIFQTGRFRPRTGLQSHSVHQTGLSGTDRPVQMGSFRPRGKRPELVSLTRNALVVDDGSSLLEMATEHDFSDRARIVQILDRVYLLEPGLAPLYWEHGLSSVHHEEGPGDSLMPYAADAVFFRGRVWALGVPGEEDLVFFSRATASANQISAAQTTDDADSEERDTFQFGWSRFQAFAVDGRGVRILPYQNQHLIVFTDRSVAQLIPDVCNILLSTRLQITDSIGLGAKHSVQFVGEDLYFMDQHGSVRSLAITQSAEARGIVNAPVSLPVRGVFDGVDTKRMNEVRSFVFRGFYGITFVRSGAVETWLYSTRDQAWSGPIVFESGNIPRGYQVFQFPQAAENLYTVALDGTDSEVFRVFRGATDNGTTITARWDSRAFTAGTPTTRKIYRTLKLGVRRLQPSGAIDLNLFYRMDEGVWQSLGTESIPIADNHPILGTSEAVLPFTLGIDDRVSIQVPLTAEAGADSLGYTGEVRLESTETERYELMNAELLSHPLNHEHDNAP